MNSKEKYYQLIKENKLIDSLKELSTLSYSKKYNTLLLIIQSGYTTDEINYALSIYKKNYIDLNRVNYGIIDSILKGLCKIRRKNENVNRNK